MISSAVPGIRERSRSITQNLMLSGTVLLLLIIAALVFGKTYGDSYEVNQSLTNALIVKNRILEEQLRTVDLDVLQETDIRKLLVSNKRYFNPSKYLAIIENQKPNTMQFQSLSFNRSLSLIKAVVLTQNYEDVIEVVNKLTSHEDIVYAQLVKRGQNIGNQISYHLEVKIGGESL